MVGRPDKRAPKSFAGREFDQTFLSALPDGAVPVWVALGSNGVSREKRMASTVVRLC